MVWFIDREDLRTNFVDLEPWIGRRDALEMGVFRTRDFLAPIRRSRRNAGAGLGECDRGEQECAEKREELHRE